MYVASRSVLGDKKNKSVRWGHGVPSGERAGGVKLYQQLGIPYSVHNQLAVFCSAVVPAPAIAAQQDGDRTK